MTDFETRSEKLRTMRAKGLAPLSYDISISEEQRVALLAVIVAADVDLPDHALEYWVGMLEGLPEVEAETPGITHGFCL